MGGVREKCLYSEKELTLTVIRDMADKFPDAQITAIDLSDPQHPWPHNVDFRVDDAQSEWTEPVDHFDLIHIRGLFGSIKDWPELYAQCYRHLKPGGWLEQMEWSVHMESVDGTVGPAFQRWTEDAIRCGQLTEKTTEIAETMAGLISDAGFVNSVEKNYKWPIGTWSKGPSTKNIGYWNLLNWEQGMEGWAIKLFTQVLGVGGCGFLERPSTLTTRS